MNTFLQLNEDKSIPVLKKKKKRSKCDYTLNKQYPLEL